jgi:hypothetical protein
MIGNVCNNLHLTRRNQVLIIKFWAQVEQHQVGISPRNMGILGFHVQVMLLKGRIIEILACTFHSPEMGSLNQRSVVFNMF